MKKIIVPAVCLVMLAGCSSVRMRYTENLKVSMTEQAWSKINGYLVQKNFQILSSTPYYIKTIGSYRFRRVMDETIEMEIVKEVSGQNCTISIYYKVDKGAFADPPQKYQEEMYRKFILDMMQYIKS